jgi:hypothetical protein
MAESLSLYEAAMAELDVEVTSFGYIEALGPDRIREMAAKRLQAEGVELIGAPSLVDRMLTREAEATVADLCLWLEELQALSKSGRPSNGCVHNFILTAAYHTCVSAGLGKTEARRAAAKRLGRPITKDKIEKATKALLKDSGRAFASIPKDRALETVASIVMTIQDELERIEARLRDEEAAHRKRRFYASGDGCFRAASSSSLVGPQD